MRFLLISVTLSIFISLPLTTISLKNRIIGGQEAYAGQFPYAAAIYKTTNDGAYFCGGCLLNAEWIVTSGHCVEGALLFNIHLGTNNLNVNDDNSMRLATDSYVLHPNFNPTTLENDIGLIKLRMPISFTMYVSPVDYLPVANLVPYTGTTALGWGQISDDMAGLIEDLQWVAVTVLSNEECSLVFGNQIYDTMVCVDGNYNEGACYGDIGGPLIQLINRRFSMVVGVSSFLSGNGCETTDPSGYTRIYPYTEWIYNVTGMD